MTLLAKRMSLSVEKKDPEIPWFTKGKSSISLTKEDLSMAKESKVLKGQYRAGFGGYRSARGRFFSRGRRFSYPQTTPPPAVDSTALANQLLNQLSSSRGSARGGSFRGGRGCYKCDGAHLMRDCPNL